MLLTTFFVFQLEKYPAKLENPYIRHKNVSESTAFRKMGICSFGLLFKLIIFYYNMILNDSQLFDDLLHTTSAVQSQIFSERTKLFCLP